MTIQERLAALEKDFSSQLNFYGNPHHGPGYHSQIPNGTWIHETRANMGYAHDLLSAGQPEQVKRARVMLDALISLQDQNPLSPTYGIWSWLVEEPLEQMSPPDWNWADFLGLKLAEIIFDYSALLPEDLLNRTKASLGHAARSIFRRNVHAGYTNIAVKGGCVTVAAGELLGEPWLADYGQQRLQAVLDHFAYHGGFNEYNSSTYTKLVLSICETGLHIIKDHTVRDHIEKLRLLAWQTLAEHFHPTTRQLCGPQSRSYQDFLDSSWLDFLNARIGLAPAEIRPDGTPAPLCPSPLVERFRSLPHSPLETQHLYIRREQGHSTIGTTWFTEEACLGSVSHDITWVQRRPILGYWLNDEAQPVVLKLRIMRDDQDFASGFVWNAQSGPRVLTASNFIIRGGDFHPNLDRPADGIFQGNELKIRYELKGKGAVAQYLGQNQFELHVGKWRAVIHTAPSYFNDQKLDWEFKVDEEGAYVESRIPLANARLDLSQVKEVAIVSGLELLESHQQPTNNTIEVEVREGILQATWPLENEKLELIAPLSPLPESETHLFGNSKES